MNRLTETENEPGSTAPEVLERLNRARKFIDLCYDLPLDLNEISSMPAFLVITFCDCSGRPSIRLLISI